MHIVRNLYSRLMAQSFAQKFSPVPQPSTQFLQSIKEALQTLGVCVHIMLSAKCVIPKT